MAGLDFKQVVEGAARGLAERITGFPYDDLLFHQQEALKREIAIEVGAALWGTPGFTQVQIDRAVAAVCVKHRAQPASPPTQENGNA